ncbi:MAG TPA: helix-turn-helix domain-containing protein [Gemmatimonadaceae bacterium]|nr:helix-turn-helix domain-containing protein [Gemmatimonadaceae bacterium]
MATSISTGIRPNTAAGKVLARLRHGPMTVEELARALRLTDNAVRNQLRKLQTANFVTLAGKRPGTSKPSTLYAITLAGQIQFSTLYLPVLTQFLAVAEGRCLDTQLDSFMLETGKSLAHRYPSPTGGLKRRVHAAAALLRTFGSVSEVGTRNGTLVIRSRACPLAALTSENAAACKVLQGFLEEHVDGRVTVCCNLTDHPQCCFEVRS